MRENLCVVISNVPERISQYVASLRILTSNFMFFSDVNSLLDRLSIIDIDLLILDNVDGNVDIASGLQQLDQHGICPVERVLVIVRQEGCASGIRALYLGVGDYLPFFLVSAELPARARPYFERGSPIDVGGEINVELDSIYPVEDRLVIRNILQAIRTDIGNIRTVSDLALRIGRKKTEINKVLINHFQKTAFEYLRDYRIDRAKELLVKTRSSIVDISNVVGYSSAANFSTAFKSVVGVSPSDYKRQILSNS